MINIYDSKEKVAAVQWTGSQNSTDSVIWLIELMTGKSPKTYSVHYTEGHSLSLLNLGDFVIPIDHYLVSRNAGPNPSPAFFIFSQEQMDQIYEICWYGSNDSELEDHGAILPKRVNN